jgi:hypothetical protein
VGPRSTLFCGHWFSGEVITVSRHARKPRRQSRLVLLLQALLVALQLVLVLLESAAAITSLLRDLW